MAAVELGRLVFLQNKAKELLVCLLIDLVTKDLFYFIRSDFLMSFMLAIAEEKTLQ